MIGCVEPRILTDVHGCFIRHVHSVRSREVLIRVDPWFLSVSTGERGDIFPPMKEQDEQFLREAIALSLAGMERGDGGPFGCVIVKDGQVVGRGNNRVTSTNDPTAHAEIVAIREACKQLGDFQLAGCTLYTSCEPCPMCLGAIYWARPDRIVYAASRVDAAAAGFDDQLIYDELPLPAEQRRFPMERLMAAEAQAAFEAWKVMEGKKKY